VSTVAVVFPAEGNALPEIQIALSGFVEKRNQERDLDRGG